MCYEKVVVVNGVFDILHAGHINLLQRARQLGDYVVVLIDSDARVKIAKGPTRPRQTAENRAKILRELRSVDEVIEFKSDEELDLLLHCIQPYYMVKGSDYRGKPIIGSQWCQNIEYVELNDQSTSNLITG